MDHLLETRGRVVRDISMHKIHKKHLFMIFDFFKEINSYFIVNIVSRPLANNSIY